jgi:1,4-alpha-glucan branching enzyme
MQQANNTPMSPEQLSLIQGRHQHPHQILGMHPQTDDGQSSIVVRAFLQDAHACEVVDVSAAEGARWPMRLLDPLGLFEVNITERQNVFPYRLAYRNTNNELREVHDPYCFLPTLGDQDLYLFNEGTELHVYDKLGAHQRLINGISGVSFAVWAPAAQRVSVVGDFNKWDGRYHPMRPLGASGVWEIFIPGIDQGAMYKYELLDAYGGLRLKSDPYATYFEPPPNNASIVHNISGYDWHDDEWMQRRRQTDWRREPISIYEVHLGSWRRKLEDGNRSLTYREIADQLVAYIKEMGYTHVELLPITEHPFDGSWGYQVTGFYAPTQRFGAPQDFMYLIDALHQNEIGVILDWVPAHFPKDAFALAEFDGTHLYEHANPQQGHHLDWDTLIFNYGRPEVRSFLAGSALGLCERYHIDGLRLDAVASMLYLDFSRPYDQWVPNKYGGRENLEAIDFLRYINRVIHQQFPGIITIAEESTAWSGVTSPVAEDGLGFDFKWNMGWMHDTLRYFSKDPIHRKWHHNDLTFGMIYQHTEKFMMTFSHDEVVHGKGSMLLKMAAEHIPEKSRNLRALYAWMWAWPGKKTLFMGSDFGQASEWRHDGSLDWHLLQYLDHDGIRQLIADLNKKYCQHPAMAKLDYDAQSFQWINNQDGNNSVLSFVRFGHEPSETIVVIGNFTPVERSAYRIGVPYAGLWQEDLNSNIVKYGGDGRGNERSIHSDAIPWDGKEHSVEVYLPGLSVLWFSFQPSEQNDTPAANET